MSRAQCGIFNLNSIFARARARCLPGERTTLKLALLHNLHFGVDPVAMSLSASQEGVQGPLTRLRLEAVPEPEPASLS